ncbi:hypothetical protein KR044_006072, partial [Drosophila immigrans]
EADASMCGSQEVLEVKSKEKARRYWTPSEEERLYEIWGRDNWRLTRNGKNTIFFGQWSEELRERFSVDVKPEEIQMKVNQTRAKFRQVKKQLQNDPSSYPLRWKKFDIINRILKNIHRPENAEPIPPEVLLNNRDVSPPREEEQFQQQQQSQQSQQQTQSVLNLTSEATGNNFYSNNSSNSNNSSSHVQVNNNNTTMSFNTELFTDQYDDIKREYDEEDYRSLPFQEPLQEYSPAEPTQLLELQTPQQQQQQQQHQLQSEYESSVVNYPGANSAQQQQYSSSNNAASASSSINHQAITAVAYINSSNNTISVATNNSNGAQVTAVQMQPLIGAVTNTVGTIATPRKRGRPFGSSNPPATDSLESIYIEEVRRKNQLLAEQTKISRQRLELEERKVELMQTFFPKCLEQQAHILARVMQLPSLQQHPQQQQLQ